MRHLLIMLLFATSCDSATAQQEPRRVKTETIRESAPGLQTLHAIDPDGTVRIDWDAVETLIFDVLNERRMIRVWQRVGELELSIQPHPDQASWCNSYGY